MIKNALIMILYLDRMISGSKGQFRQRFCKKKSGNLSKICYTIKDCVVKQ